MIVLDASAALELLFNSARGRQVARRIAPTDVSLHAPHLIDLEVAQALRRYERAGALASEPAHQALTHLRALDIQRYPHALLLERIWTLRHNLTAYDAAYVALAEALQAPLLTCDHALASVAGLATSVELVE